MTREHKINRYCLISMPLLLILIVVSLFGIVFMKDLNRRKFIYSQALQQDQDELQLQWGKLLLEQSTLTTQSRVQKIAQGQLGMIVPNDRKIIALPRDN